MRLSLFVLASVLLIAHASPLCAQTTQRLSLAEAVHLAQQHSPLLRGAVARVAGAEARTRGAGAPPNPSLSVGPHFGNSDTTGGTDEDYLLTQTFELGDKQRQRIHAARAEQEAARAERAGTGSGLVFEVQSAYFESLRADSERQLAADTLATAQAFAKTAETQFQAGAVARSNVVRSQIEQTRAEQALAAAETERANRYATLCSLTGVAEDADLTLTDTLTFTPTTYRLPDLQNLALRQRPDLQVAQHLRTAREADLHGARAQSQPDLFLEARHSTIDPAKGGNSLHVGLLFPLFDLGRNRADAQSAEAALQEQEAALAEAIRTARLEVETAFRNLEQAQRDVQSFQTGRLVRAKELLDMAQTGYDKGATSYIELLDAQQVYRSEQTDYARALADFNIAKAALQRAIGTAPP